MFEEHELPSVPRRHVGAETAGAPRLVVAMGASAGGLQALQEFFEALDDSAGMAFVVIEHLDPASKSLLPSILMQFTTLPVSELSEGQALSADHVYVAPANALVELDGATFRLSPLLDSAHRRSPIDALFRSVALAFGPRSVGIVLSGTGADGSSGAQQIANEGGMTLAQAPEQAKYDSMPRSAIATGVIDHVLSAAQMAHELLAYVGHVEALASEELDLGTAEAIAQHLPEICDILQHATEHNFRHYKTTTLVRRILRRMQVLRLASTPSYLDLLRAQPEEVTQLFRELLIGVTSFFRDPQAFETLAREVIVPLVTTRRDTIRIWVPGCASGEEAYTLAILVREALEGVTSPPAVQIFATDIDERALSIARQGIYPLGIAEHVSKERLERFFIKKGKRFQVNKDLRELCLFSPHNLITDPPFSRLDVISCRNLLIYFGPHLQKKLIPLFHYALRSNGYLFLGPSESISTHKELFLPIDAKHRISQRKPITLSSSAVLSSAAAYRAGARTPELSADSPPDLHQLMQRILLDEFAPKAVIVSEDGQILSASGEMERYLTVTEGTFQNNVIRLARPGLRVGLRSALTDAIKIRRKVVHDKVSVQTDSGVQRVRVTVQPMPKLGDEAELFMVVFQDLGPLLPRDESSTALSAEADSLIEQLERELSSTREDLEKSIQDLEAANEELKSSNEELLSMNEELQSANEELETSKEEVQSSNEALARAHANLSNLLTSTAIATIFLDEKLNISSFTPAVSAIYNVLPADVGRPLSHITYRSSRMPPLPSPSALRASDHAQEDDVITDDGSWFLRRCHPYRTHDGKADGMVVTFIDVTKLKHAEAAARRHESQLQLITDSLPVLISYVDAHQRYGFNNLAYERWFGVSRDSIHGKHVRQLLGEEAYQKALPRIQIALGGSPVGFETELPHRDGSRRTIRAEYVPDKSPDGEVRGYFSLKYDVTDERRLAQSLAEAKSLAENASLAKSDFLANVSHEVRTPLTAMLGYSELLQAHITDPDNLACIEALRRNGRHLVEIINDILDLSKIEAGMLATERLHISPGGILREVVDSFRVRAAEKGLTLDRIQEGPLPGTVESDPTRLRQVLFNLLSNAIKFTDAGGVRVTARLLQQAQLIEIAVKDTGIGISQAQRAALFAPFAQADKSITRRYGGTSLGLAISKRLVELLGGQLSVTSEVGVGSTFTFTLPTGPLDSATLSEEEAAEPAPPPILPASRLFGRRVLVVDDRRDMRYLIQTYLEEAGAEVEGAGDGAVALERAARAIQEEKPFDTIILDMQMPVMDGYVAAPRLRELGHRGSIIALTANAMKGERERCLAAGCDQYFAKPVDRLRLLYAVAQQGAAAGLPGESITASEAEPPTRYRPRALIVDDNLDSLDVLSALLENADIDVTAARNGAEALERAASTHPNVVILDLGLPDVDGYAVLEHLRQFENLRATRFIALTGRSSSEELARMAEAGFHHQLVKPPDFKQLITLIKAAVQ